MVDVVGHDTGGVRAQQGILHGSMLKPAATHGLGGLSMAFPFGTS